MRPVDRYVSLSGANVQVRLVLFIILILTVVLLLRLTLDLLLRLTPDM